MRTPVLILAALASVATAAAAAPSGVITRSALPQAERPTFTMTAADRTASDTALAVERLPRFAGIRLTPDRATIEVYVTGPDAGLEAAARRAARGAPLRFTTVRHSYASLQALRARIAADRRALAALGARITNTGVRDSLNSVVIGVAGLTPEIAALFATRYPHQPVLLEAGSYATDMASRLDDSAPWNGGDIISPDGPDNDCTAGPAVQNSAGHRYLLTAGHCFRSEGTSGYIYRVFQGSDQVTYDDPVLIGYAKAENPGALEQGYDVAVIDPTASASALVWKTTFPTTVGTAAPQRGTFRAVENSYVCFSGGYSGELCDGKILEFDGSYVQADFGEVIHTNRAYSASSILGGPGDSGGPVYQQRTDGEIYISGIILAEVNNGWPCNNTSFVNRGAQCGDEIWFGGIGSLQAHLGLTIVVR